MKIRVPTFGPKVTPVITVPSNTNLLRPSLSYNESIKTLLYTIAVFGFIIFRLLRLFLLTEAVDQAK